MELALFFIMFVFLLFIKCSVAFSMLLAAFTFIMLKGLPLLILPERISAGLFSFPSFGHALFHPGGRHHEQLRHHQSDIQSVPRLGGAQAGRSGSR